MNNNVYLVPLSNGTYVPYIEPFAPNHNAVLLTKEGEYPASLVGICFDAYGNGKRCERIVQDRSELLEELLIDGQMCCALARLWDYDVDRDYSDDIGNLFDAVYHTRMDAIRGNGSVNCKYYFTGSTSLEEYCACCIHEKRIDKYSWPENSGCTKSDNQIDDLPF